MPKYAADPKAPKRPQTGYFLFMGENRERLVKSLGTKDLGVIGKAMGAEWKNLSDAKKKPYLNKAAKARAKFDAANEKYKKTSGYATWKEGQQEWKKAQKKANAKKNLKAMLKNQPKRPLSGYMLFANDQRPKMMKPGMGVAEIGKAIGAAWGNASASVKGKFNGQAAKLKAAHEVKMTKYKKTGEYQAYQQAVADNKEAERKAKKLAKKRAARLAASAN